MVWLDTTSGMRASSMFSARMAKYASFVVSGTKVCRVYEGESNFLCAC